VGRAFQSRRLEDQNKQIVTNKKERAYGGINNLKTDVSVNDANNPIFYRDD
jgi:hypothetical protein